MRKPQIFCAVLGKEKKMIRVENLRKSFGGITAMDNVTAEIQNSSIFGLIGSNGAGKSTVMRL